MKRSHSQTKFRRAALCIALGACLSAMAPVAMAQSATGGVAGRATAGDQVVVTREATGLTRSVTVGAAARAHDLDGIARALTESWNQKPDGASWDGCNEASASHVSMRGTGG